MSLQALKNQVYKLSVSDRLELIKAIIYSLEDELRPRIDRKGAVERMRGLAKTDQPPPTDTEVEAMLEERTDKKIAAEQSRHHLRQLSG